ncbi:MAG TPA: rhomboid family intramembrane serine protease [Candidatus Dormibacteraeota bacterium]|nr:rhomboid family intramembrane serine protease [Candidatus Dormibacteraeota bacterium]
MPLSDRKYMRDPYNPPRWTNKLIVVLIACFVIQSILMFYADFDAIRHFGLTVEGLKQGKIWQILTFQFLHSAPMPWHVLFNCLGLWFFGRPVEEQLGSKRFLTLYLASGLAGGLLQAFLTLVLPRHFDFPVVGASAGVCGMIAIFCSMYPMQELTTWIYFFPIQLRARVLLMFLTGISLFGAIIPFDGIAHAAHLGGVIVGITYVRRGRQIGDWVSRFMPQTIPRGLRLKPMGTTPGRPWLKRNKPPLELVEGNFISREIDPILDKIAAEGFESLTEKERETLEAARKKMK